MSQKTDTLMHLGVSNYATLPENKFRIYELLVGKEITFICKIMFIRGQNSNTTSGILVTMVGIAVAARTILRLRLKTASYEFTLNKMNNRNKSKALVWNLFWTWYRTD